MRIAFSSSLVALAATAAGLRIISPAIDQKVAQDDTITVRWESVSTDPPKMDIYLVNQNTYPNTQEEVATGVDTSLGKYVIKAKDVGDVDTGGGYQVNFVSTTGGGILAQSQQFKFNYLCLYICVDFHAFYFYLIVFCCDNEFFDFCFLYFFSDSFFYCIYERYSHLHQCVYLCHLFSIYYLAYFYFCPYLIFYDGVVYQCVHPYSVQFCLKEHPFKLLDHNPFKHPCSFKFFFNLFQDSLLYTSPFILYVVFTFVFHMDTICYHVLVFILFHEDPIFFIVIIFCPPHSFFLPHRQLHYECELFHHDFHENVNNHQAHEDRDFY
ncbi:hypothetical protein N7454_008466 [Penicillium verhagenii]|nr:hypothetical protein N7454_008466 [Penicillium verhagenii]